jgi:hypothetical protein
LFVESASASWVTTGKIPRVVPVCVVDESRVIVSPPAIVTVGAVV